MGSFFLPLLLTLLITPQDTPPSFTLDATIEDAKKEDGTPILRVRGTTNFPHRSILMLFYHYDRVEPGHHIAYRAVHVLEGKFEMDFPIYHGRNLEGRHLVMIRLNPHNQEEEPRRQFGSQLREYEKVGELILGTPEEIAAARLREQGKLAAEIDRLVALAEESYAILLEEKSKLTAATWTPRTEAVAKEIEAIERRTYNVAEYHALGIADIAEDGMENLTRPLHDLLEVGKLLIARKQPEEQLLQTAKAIRDFMRNQSAPFLTRLRPAAEPGPNEMRVALQEVGSLFAPARDLRGFLQQAQENGQNDLPAVTREFRKQVQGTLLRLPQFLPKPLQEGIATLTRAAGTLCSLLDQAASSPDTPPEGYDEAVHALDRELQALQDALELYLQSDR